MSVSVTDEQQHPVDHDQLRSLARHVLHAQSVPQRMDLSILLVDSGVMAELNREHLGGDGPTDVLAFPIDAPQEAPPAGPAVLGEVVLCPQVAARQAQQAGHDVAAELRLLTVHGILHVLGMDHADPDAERRMFARTDELLAGFDGDKGAA